MSQPYDQKPLVWANRIVPLGKGCVHLYAYSLHVTLSCVSTTMDPDSQLAKPVPDSAECNSAYVSRMGYNLR